MKLIITFLSLTWMTLGLARDCVFCPPFNWGRIYDPIPVPEWPFEYVSIKKPDYERNTNASFCKRPVEMIDTIVLHHTETRNTDTPERINEYHLNRGTQTDPWYMIGYSYVINSAYPNESKTSSPPEASVSEGRPIDIVGAHAGSTSSDPRGRYNVFVPMDKEQQKIWDDGKIVCGKEDGEFKPDPELLRNGKIKANVTTIGVAIVGNYSPFSRQNLNGYSRDNPRYPTKKTLDLIARTSCQLQKKYPRIKYIKWHNYYHPTSCPGNIVNYIGEIKTLTRNLGCEFY